MTPDQPSVLRSETIDLLADLLRLPGVSGWEDSVRERLAQAWSPFVDRLEVSPLGNLVALRDARSTSAPSLLLTAHMDAVGLVVSEILGEFLRVEMIGDVDSRSLAGQRVTVLADDPLTGFVVARPKDLLPESAREGEVDLEHLLVDVALDPAELEKRVQVGDPVTFEQGLQNFGDGLFFGRALDNRISLVALTQALQNLSGDVLEVNLIVAATVQEETSRGGGPTLGERYQPEAAIVVDATFARAPDLPSHTTFPVGQGLTIGAGPSLHPRLRAWIEQQATSRQIAWKREVLPKSSGTDADLIQLTGKGVRCGLVSIPIRNMHTGVEVGAFSDIEACAELLTALASGAPRDLAGQLAWD